MWQTKYASAVPINLGLGFDSAVQWRRFPLWVSVVRVDDYYSSAGLNLKSALHAAAAELNCLGVLLEFNASQII